MYQNKDYKQKENSNGYSKINIKSTGEDKNPADVNSNGGFYIKFFIDYFEIRKNFLSEFCVYLNQK